MKHVTYKIICFPKLQKWAAVAWNYELGVLLATSDHGSYTMAREELEKLCTQHNAQLRWFDGEYNYGDDGMLYPIG